MRPHLVFSLAAPLAAFGDLAGHERRGGTTWPGRSAILGLIGAALGIERSDRDGQAALSAGYGVAVQTRAMGAPLRDYHTTQTVPTAKARRPATRAAALAAAGRAVNTVITIREYRTDVAFDAAVWPRESARWDLDELATALRRPVYTLWLGRKGCPLAAPLRPHVVQADDAIAAFRAADPGPLDDGLGLNRAPVSIAADLDGVRDPPQGTYRQRRWDEPGDRETWQFAAREVLIVPVRAPARREAET